MKRCPDCRRNYYDDTLSYCLDDGASLVDGPASGDVATQFLPGEMGSGDSRTEMFDVALISDEIRVGHSNSIAVLPFANISADAENDYFCDGLAEELLNALAKINDLKVAARTSAFSFRGTNVNVSEIGRALGVNTILEGSVRRSGSRLRITVQLVNAPDGYHLWSERYDREMQDIFDVQDEITLAVVDALKVKLLGKEKAAVLNRYTENTEAYRLYLKGRYHLNKWTADGLTKGIEYFNRAIALEPGFAPAYSGLVDAYGSLSSESLTLSPKEAFQQARAAAIRALEIDDTLAEAHTSLALIKLNFDWDWSGAEAGLKRAIKLNPNYVAAHHWYSHCLIVLGRAEESLAISKRALELDPLDLQINAHLAWHYYHTGEYDEVVRQCLKTLEMDPNYHEAHWFLGWAYEEKAMYQEAITEFQRAVDCSGGSARMLAELGHAYGLAGMPAEAATVLDQLKALSKEQYVSPYNMALVYTGLGEKDAAFEWLGKACDDRSGLLIYLRTQHSFDGLHADFRFANCLRRIGLQA